MVFNAKKGKGSKMVVLFMAFIYIVGVTLTGCGSSEAEIGIDIAIDTEEEIDGNTDVVEQEKNLSGIDEGDAVQVLIQDGDDVIHAKIHFEEINISFYYPSSFTEEVSAQIIAASDSDSWTDYPENKRIFFYNYQLPYNAHATRTDNAYIKLTSIEKFFSLCGDWAEKEINHLKTFIKNRAVPDNFSIPHYSPEPNSGQLFSANVAFIDTEVGSGLRYLTQFHQGTSPLINNADLAYVYQGITTDQQYYLTAYFPVYYSKLDRHNEEYLESKEIDITSQADWSIWLETYDEYLDITIQMLNEADAEDYVPSLLLLDEIINSFKIE